jgi:hypothetical protein
MGYMSGTRRYGNSNYANRSFGPKSVETGKEYNIQITETSRKGECVTSVGGIRYSKKCCIGIRRRE